MEHEHFWTAEGGHDLDKIYCDVCDLDLDKYLLKTQQALSERDVDFRVMSETANTLSLDADKIHEALKRETAHKARIEELEGDLDMIAEFLEETHGRAGTDQLIYQRNHIYKLAKRDALKKVDEEQENETD